ncbi:TPA: hypothetical protein ACOH71_004204, partial [Yersinia enterocolitica]
LINLKYNHAAVSFLQEKLYVLTLVLLLACGRQPPVGPTRSRSECISGHCFDNNVKALLIN